MKTKIKAFPVKHLIVMTAEGNLDLVASKAALKAVAAAPGFDARSEVLLDLREIHCTMSVTDIYELAGHMAAPATALPTDRKIALLVDGTMEFDRAKFLELCTSNRGVAIHAFEDYDAADVWLNATLPPDPAETTTAP